MLAGDTSYLEWAMLRGTVDGVSPDETVAQATLADIRSLCVAASDSLSADPRSAISRTARSTTPAGMVTDVSDVTTALRRGNAA